MDNNTFTFIYFSFGALIIYSAYRILFGKGKKNNKQSNNIKFKPVKKSKNNGTYIDACWDEIKNDLF
ncbi:MAG: hypothetical protein FWG91_05715 [Lachnospiraceae bacterium]|nr:hypothetical protein [Lachnospiraceae bacterium]